MTPTGITLITVASGNQQQLPKWRPYLKAFDGEVLGNNMSEMGINPILPDQPDKFAAER